MGVVRKAEQPKDGSLSFHADVPISEAVKEPAWYNLLCICNYGAKSAQVMPRTVLASSLLGRKERLGLAAASCCQLRPAVQSASLGFPICEMQPRLSPVVSAVS